MSGFGTAAPFRQAPDKVIYFAQYLRLVRPEDIVTRVLQSNQPGRVHACFKRGRLIAFHLVSCFRSYTVGRAIRTADDLKRINGEHGRPDVSVSL